MTFRPSATRRIALFSALLAVTACSSGTTEVVENSPTAVTVKYGGFGTDIDDATQLAQKVCASHGKTARLRKVNDEGLGRHFGHFDCV
jgi:hypothetical protein